jgi:hypothetical protein
MDRLYQQLLGQDLASSPGRAAALLQETSIVPGSAAQLEIFYLHVALSPVQLGPQLAGLLQLRQVLGRYRLDMREAALCLALSATRFRLSWPHHRRAELSAVWDKVSNAARRHIVPDRLVGVLQLVHMASNLATMLPPDGVLEKLNGWTDTSVAAGIQDGFSRTQAKWLGGSPPHSAGDW